MAACIALFEKPPGEATAALGWRGPICIPSLLANSHLVHVHARFMGLHRRGRQERVLDCLSPSRALFNSQREIEVTLKVKEQERGARISLGTHIELTRAHASGCAGQRRLFVIAAANPTMSATTHIAAPSSPAAPAPIEGASGRTATTTDAADKGHGAADMSTSARLPTSSEAWRRRPP